MKTTIAAVLSVAILSAPALAQPAPPVDLGDDSGGYPRDGECDDARFIGPGVSEPLVTDWIGRDATDCAAALADGSAALAPLFAEPATPAAIEYGADSGDYAKDGECDDIRFAQADDATRIFIVDDIGGDATDCREAVNEGRARWQGAVAKPVQALVLE